MRFLRHKIINIPKAPKKLLVVTALCLLSSLAFGGAAASAFPIEFPAPNHTYNGPTDNYFGGAADVVNKGGEFFLYCQGGGHVVAPNWGGCTNSTDHCQSQDATDPNCQWANRPNGQIGTNVTYTIIEPKTILDSSRQYGIDVIIEDGCSPASDNIGWEDHTDADPTHWHPGGRGIASVVANITTGDTEGPFYCSDHYSNGPGLLGGSMTISVKYGDFISAVDKYGYVGGDPSNPYMRATLQLEVDGLGGGLQGVAKNFRVTNINGAYVGPTDGNVFNLRNPQADYHYNTPPGDCPPVSSNCPQYGSLNRFSGGDNPASSFHFKFTPDCSYDPSRDSNVLKWYNQNIGPPTQPDTEYINLYDNGAPVAINGQINYAPNGNDQFAPPGGWKMGDTYTLDWNNVDRAHGLSIQLPFTEFGADIGLNCNWHLGPHSSVSGPDNSKYTFTHWISNSSGSYPASFHWYIQGQYTSGGNVSAWTAGTAPCNGANSGANPCPLSSDDIPNSMFPNGLPGGQSTPGHIETYQFPAGARNGDKYCEKIVATNGTGQGTAAVASNPVCVTYGQAAPGSIQGSVYEMDAHGNHIPLGLGSTDAPLGVPVVDCRGDTAATDATGSWGFQVPTGDSFCVEVDNSFKPPAGFSGPYLRPWGNGPIQAYQEPNNSPPANDTTSFSLCGPYNSFSPASDGTMWCPGTGYGRGGRGAYPDGSGYGSSEWWNPVQGWNQNAGYEWQWKGEHLPYCYVSICKSFDKNDADLDNDDGNQPNGQPNGDWWDGGYDMVYTPNPPQGFVDSATCGQQSGVSGWAHELALPDNETLTVDIWMDGPNSGPNKGTNVGQAAADVPSTDVGTHRFNFPLTGYADGNSHTFYVYAENEDLNGQPNGTETLLYNSSNGSDHADMQACANFTTQGDTTVKINPTNENPTSYSTTSHAWIAYDSSVNPSFNPWINLNPCVVDVTKNGANMPPPKNPYTGCSGDNYNRGGNQSSTAGGNPEQTTINGPSDSVGPVNAGDVFHPTLTLQYQSGLVYADGTVTNATGPNVIDGNHVTIVNEPYFKVFNSGVTSGCSSDTSKGQISSWNNDSGQNPSVGAGAQFSALAQIGITGFASGQGTFSAKTGDRQSAGTALSFANTDSSGNPTPNDAAGTQDSPPMGGNFAQFNCSQSVNQPTGAQNISGSSFNIDNSTNGKYYRNGSLNLDMASGSSVGNGSQVEIYVNGDVYIKPSNGGIKTSAWSYVWNRSNPAVPSFELVASGNIYVDPSVTELDGTYVAQKDGGGNGGKIYTCAYGIQNLVPAQSLYDTCKNQLLVVGSFVADQVNLMRTFGSLRNSNQDCSSNSGAVPLSTNSPLSPNAYILPCPAAGHNEAPLYLKTKDGDWLYTTSSTEGDSLGYGPATLVGYTSPSGDLTLWRGHTPSNAHCVTLSTSDPNCNIEGPLGNVFSQAGQGADFGPRPNVGCSNQGAASTFSDIHSGAALQSCAGEVFILSPEMYLNSNPATVTNGGAGSYQAFTSLPPVL